MRLFAILGLFVFSLGSTAAMADDHDGHHHPCPGDHCEPKTRSECFNLVCNFSNHSNPVGYKNCRVAARFDKDVTEDGGEVEDQSDSSNNPKFQVVCDTNSLFNNSARRFTDLLGTRIQGETGPFPAITLPRGALHTGANESAGSHVSPATLEIDTGSTLLRTTGSCNIWTGHP